MYRKAEEERDISMRRALGFNRLGIWFLVVVSGVFQVCFWGLAARAYFMEYTREEYQQEHKRVQCLL